MALVFLPTNLASVYGGVLDMPLFKARVQSTRPMRLTYSKVCNTNTGPTSCDVFIKTRIQDSLKLLIWRAL